MTHRSKGEREKPVFSAFTILQAIGEELSTIRAQDRLTYDDIGAVLGVSADQAAKYCAAEATMNAVTLARGKREWNGRFTGKLDRLCHDSRPASDMTDRARESKVLKAVLAMSVALSDDEKIDADEVAANRATFEDAYDALGELLGKPMPLRSVG